MLTNESFPQWWYRYWCGFLIALKASGEWASK